MWKVICPAFRAIFADLPMAEGPKRVGVTALGTRSRRSGYRSGIRIGCFSSEAWGSSRWVRGVQAASIPGPAVVSPDNPRLKA